MLSTVIMVVVSGAIYQLLITTQRLSGVQAERLGLQATVRGAALVVVNELKELGAVPGGSPAQNDIVSIAPSAISYRAARGVGYACQAVSGSQIRIGRNLFSGHRDPQAGRDSAWVYVAGTPTGADSGWIPLGISNVSIAAACLGGAGPAITLTTSNVGSSGVLGAGTPVRIYELMELALYQSEGTSWLGMRSVSAGEAIQPLFGPLADGDGFRLAYADAAGLPTNVTTAVRSIAVTIRAASQNSSSTSRLDRYPLAEELTAQVMLRNAFR